MSLKDRLAKKALGVNTDDLDSRPGPSDYQPRTAPGQLMGLQAKVANLEKELAAARGAGAGMSQTIPLEQLHEIEGRRRKLTDEQFEELKENLRNNDLITPVTVRPRESGGYEIVSGHNRVAAYRELGRTEIEAVVRSLDEERAVLGAFYANLLQPNLPDYEKYHGFRLIRERRPDLTQEQIAQMAGVSQSLVSKLLAFEDLPADVHTILMSRPDAIGAPAARSLAALAKQGKTQQVIDAVRKVTDEGMDQAAAVAYASKVDAAPAQAKPKVDIKTFKVGKKPLCSYRRTDTVLRVDFKDSSHADAFHKELGELLARYAAGLGKE